LSDTYQTLLKISLQITVCYISTVYLPLSVTFLWHLHSLSCCPSSWNAIVPFAFTQSGFIDTSKSKLKTHDFAVTFSALLTGHTAPTIQPVVRCLNAIVTKMMIIVIKI